MVVVRASGEESAAPVRNAVLRDDREVLEFIASRGKSRLRLVRRQSKWRVSEIYVGSEISSLNVARLREGAGRVQMLVIASNGQILDALSLPANQAEIDCRIEADDADRLLLLEAAPFAEGAAPLIRVDVDDQSTIERMATWSRDREAEGATGAATQTGPLSWGVDADPSVRVSELLAAGDLGAAQGEVERLPMDGAGRAARLKVYGQLKMFERIDELCAAAPEDEQLSYAFLAASLDSAANQGRMDDIVALCGRLAGAPRAHRTTQSLLRMAAYGQVLPDAMRDWVRSAVAANLPDRRAPLNRLIHYAHDCLSTGHWAEFEQARAAAEELASTDVERARCDLLNSQASFVLGSPRGQLDQINRCLSRFNIAPVGLRDGSRGLSAANVVAERPASRIAEQPLVSVVMTTFNRPDTLNYAIGSVMNQSYENLELVVVDDASSDGTADAVARLAEDDPRIRLVRLTENGGTYIAKNNGLLACKGVFVTCQDSDDWAHPQKLEVAVQALLDNPEAIATTVQHVRCNDVQGLKSRIGYLRKDFSSLMFRREPVLAQAGFFDSARAGADAEFQARLERIWGAGSVVHLPHLLSIVDWAENTLTGGGQYAMNDELGIMSPARHAYRRSFLSWHSREPQPFVAFPLETRPFEIQA